MQFITPDDTAFEDSFFGIDFEGRSKLNIREVGAAKYASDPSTQLICFSWMDKQTGEAGLWWPGDPLPAPMLDALERRYTFVAHNAGFEKRIWQRFLMPLLDQRYAKRTDFQTEPRKWLCTAARAAANGWPRGLDECAHAMGLEGKDEEGRKALEAMWKIDARSNYKDTPELREKAGRYCQKDTAIMFEIMDRTKPLSEWEAQVWEIDQAINERGIPVDLRSIQRIQERLDDPEQGVYRHLQNRVITATNHYVGKLTQTAKFKEWLNTILPDKIPNLQAATIERYVLGWDNLTKPDHVRSEAWEAARAALSMKSFATLAAPKKYRAILDRAVPSAVGGWGFVYDSYIFHGAHTGRWTAKGVQTQNLLRKTAPWWLVEALMDAHTLEDLDFLEELGHEPIQIAGEGVRPVIRALPKHKLVVGDFSKIETCVLFWLSNAKEGLAMLRAGQDVYCDLASAIYQEKITKAQPFKRLMGKQGILGLGYGCGAPTFVDMLRDQHRVLITRALAQRTVDAYREKYKAVTRYWYDLQAVIRKAIREKGTFQLGPLTIMASKKVMIIKLPSGRKLRYRYPEVSLDGDISFMGVHPKTKQWTRLRQWGGGFTENVVQAIANDLLRQAMIDTSEEGYKLIMHSHDELVAHEREKYLDLQHFTHIMEFRKWPKGQWWDDIPIEVEAFITERYSK